MPADASIAMSVKDNLSMAILSMRNSMTAYRKDAEELGNELDRLSEQKTTVKVEVDKAMADVKAAKAAFFELGKAGADAASLAAAEDDWRKAELRLESVRIAYSEVSRQVRETTRAFEDASGAISKFDNRAGSGGSGSAGDGILSALGKAGLTDMIGDALGQLSDTAIGSMFGSEAGGVISGALSSALSGAAMGSLAGPIGTAIGAAVGGAAGLITSGSQAFQARDDAFKSYYQDLYQTNSSATAESISTGSGIASGREDDLRVLSALLDDDEDAARRFQESLIELGRTPPFSYDTVSALSKDMLGLGISTEGAIERINMLADAAAALDWSESNVSTVISYLESAQLAGALDSRIVKSLSKMGVNAYEALAGEFGISEDKVLGSLGDLDVDRAVNAIYTYIGGQFAGSAAGLIDTYSGASGILESYQTDIDAAAGEAYNRERTQGLRDEIAAYSGALGEAMSSLNAISGETQALLDNLKDQYQREALSAVLLGDQSGELFTEEARTALEQLRADYVEASAAYEESVRETGKGNLEAGMRMEALKEKAISLATAAYDSSQEVQTLQDVQLEQIAATRELTAAFNGWANSYAIQQEESKGLAATASGSDYYTSAVSINAPVSTRGSGHAYGLDRVPYDDYPALLHEGERVLTAREARAQDAARPTVNINVTGNTFGAGMDAEAVAQALADQITLQLAAGGGR